MTLPLLDMRVALRGPDTRLAQRVAALKVANLVNIIHPADRQIYLELSRRVGKLKNFVSSPLGLHGIEKSDWDSLDACLQKTVTIRRPQRHPLRFDEQVVVLIPWDTLGQLKAFRPDVILTHEAGFRSLLSVLYARKKQPRVPVVLSVGMTGHTEQGRGRLRNVLRRWLLRQVDVIAVNGSATARYVVGLGADPARIFWTPYVTLPQSSARGPATRGAEAAHRLLYVGQFIERKGLVPFVEAMARWAEAHPTRQVEFWLVGSGPLEGKLRSLPLPGNVRLRWLGRLGPSEIAERYAQAGIFALPTLADEWGLVVNEAMASALPILGSVYSQAVEELCEDGRTGWTFRPDVPGETEHALDAALNTSVDRLDEMRAAARERVTHLTAHYAADRIVDAIGAALDARSPQTG
jgi:glycosyltransferase involved in cell wall biosynthesis